MAILPILRLVVLGMWDTMDAMLRLNPLFIPLGVALFFSLNALGLSAHLAISSTKQLFGDYIIFAELGMATGILTMASLPIL